MELIDCENSMVISFFKCLNFETARPGLRRRVQKDSDADTVIFLNFGCPSRFWLPEDWICD